MLKTNAFSFAKNRPMNQEAALIKYLVKEIIYGNCRGKIFKILSSPNLDLNAVKELFSYHEMGPYLYVIIKDKPQDLPEAFYEALKSTYYHQVFQYARLYDEFIKIIHESQRNNVLILPIKGFSNGEEYCKKFGFRSQIDIDLLIREDELEKGVNLLEKLEFEKYLIGNESYWRKEQCHLSFIKKVESSLVMVELHWNLDFKRCRKNVLPSLWGRVRETRLKNERFLALSPEDNIFSLALHQRRFGKPMNLKYICDIGIILKKEILDWEYILKTAFDEKVRASLYFLLLQTQFVLDKDMNEYLAKLRIPFWQRKILNSIINKYIYSHQNRFKISYLYTLSHFFIYDDIVYPLKYILNIPQEQFARFYQLPLYSKRTTILYKFRCFYIVYRLLKRWMDWLFLQKSLPFFDQSGSNSPGPIK